MVLKKRNGFTLVELLLVMGILAILTIIAIGIFNPIALTNKAKDARKKKDLSRMKVAFEEYFNDKGCYPTESLIGAIDCGGNGFSPWLSDWPCDPNGNKYYYVTDCNESTCCPKWYKAYTKLENLNDKDIPSGWSNRTGNYHVGDGSLSNGQVNYGVSSPNVGWDDFALEAICTNSGTQYCFGIQGSSSCQPLDLNQRHNNAYIGQCLPECRVSCCLNGKVCN